MTFGSLKQKSNFQKKKNKQMLELNVMREIFLNVYRGHKTWSFTL